VRARERRDEGLTGTFLPRTGPRQNVIMLIRDWFENVKCTRRSTAGYHEPPFIGPPSSISYAALSPSLSPSLSSLSASYVPLPSCSFSPPLSSTDIYGIFFIALARARTPAAFRFARSRLISSHPEEAPGTRNVSISVTVDAVPSRVSSPDYAGIRDWLHARARARW